MSVLALSFILFLNCSPDCYPSFLARFKRSKTVKVKKFPLFKNLNKTLLFRHGHTVKTARLFCHPLQCAESHPFKTSQIFFSTMPYYRPFALLPAIQLPAIQFHLPNTFSFNPCATAISLNNDMFWPLYQPSSGCTFSYFKVNYTIHVFVNKISYIV
jgi:hypothetical protein